jgi:hypothetical protein
MPEYITNKGLEIIANRLKGTGTEPVYLAWGTGSTVADPSATDLDTEASEARLACVSSIDSELSSNDTYRLAGAMVADGSKTIKEWGIFDAAVAGNLLLIGSSSAGYTMTIGQLIAFVFRIRFSRAS